MTQAELTDVASYCYGEPREAAGEILRLRSALFDAKLKLQLYRNAHSGKYIGGVEYTQLMKRIDDALSP